MIQRLPGQVVVREHLGGIDGMLGRVDIGAGELIAIVVSGIANAPR
jgi:hypothetical protein